MTKSESDRKKTTSGSNKRRTFDDVSLMLPKTILVDSRPPKVKHSAMKIIC